MEHPPVAGYYTSYKSETYTREIKEGRNTEDRRLSIEILTRWYE